MGKLFALTAVAMWTIFYFAEVDCAPGVTFGMILAGIAILMALRILRKQRRGCP